MSPSVTSSFSAPLGRPVSGDDARRRPRPGSGRSISPADRLTLQTACPPRVALRHSASWRADWRHHQQAQIVHQAHLVGQAAGTRPAAPGRAWGDASGPGPRSPATRAGVAGSRSAGRRARSRRARRRCAGRPPAPGATGRRSPAPGHRRRPRRARPSWPAPTASSARRSSSAASGASGPPSDGHRADRDGRIDVEAGDPQRLLQRLAQPFGGSAVAARRPGRRTRPRRSGRRWRRAGRRRPGASPGPPAPGRRARGPGPRSGGAGGRGRRRPARTRRAAVRVSRGAAEEAAAVQQAGQDVVVARRRTWSPAPPRRRRAGRPPARRRARGRSRRRACAGARRPRSPPAAGFRMRSASARSCGRASGDEGGARTFRGQRAQAQRARRAGEAHLVVARAPDPQGGVGGGQRLDGRGRVPGHGCWSRVVTACRRPSSAISRRRRLRTRGRTGDDLPMRR